MILIIDKKATDEQMKQMAEDLDGYIKVVVDIELGILAGGGKRHVDSEQMLLKAGSKQDNLWGGGYDVETKQIDYNSMINVRPRQQNMSRDVMSAEIRSEFDKIVKELLIF
ncbi:MAG: hypothetical protein HY431_00785 [Candidatus Levybacteria bacterium]|nr:hypothetical protein [Candidatus Levybacteria bacterium]